MTRRLFLLLLTVLALSLGVAACGGDDDDDDGGSAQPPAETDTGGGGGATLQLAADPSGALKFDTTELAASAGEVTIELTNDSGLQHDVAIEGNGVAEQSETITEGTTSVRANLEPGEYEFFCAVDGHRAAGMEGTLTVN
jgi:plastocyanin